jgi:cGMP-dependent protein kinase 2
VQYVAIVLFQIRGPIDLGNFEKFPKEKYVPPDETSGWDKDF